MKKSDCPWESDALSDYWNANDDYRIQMLLKNGYDPSLLSEAKRLFPGSFSNPGQEIVEPHNQKQDSGCLDSVPPASKFPVKAVVAAVASALLFVVGMLSDLPGALSTLSAVISWFRNLI